jgi:hypothetical protein
MAAARELKGELRRLVLARTDLESADAMLMTLVALPEFHARVERNSAALGLWTGALVSYARPFKRGGVGVADEWNEFEHQPWLTEMHHHFLRLRDKLFAHNDAMPMRAVQLVPPAGAREQRGRMTFATINALKRLCSAQLERMGTRIEVLAVDLSRGQSWPDDIPIDLGTIRDDLKLMAAPSPFRAPLGPGGHRWDDGPRNTDI